MKKSDLRSLIREEIEKVLSEGTVQYIKFDPRKLPSKEDYAKIDLELMNIPSAFLQGNAWKPEETKIVFDSVDNSFIKELIKKYKIKVISTSSGWERDKEKPSGPYVKDNDDLNFYYTVQDKDGNTQIKTRKGHVRKENLNEEDIRRVGMRIANETWESIQKESVDENELLKLVLRYLNSYK